MIYQLFEIINKDDTETVLKKFDVADEIFDLDDFAYKLQSSNTDENAIIVYVLTVVI